ncbi:MAG: glycosyltransferase family 2 protein [Candidatus Cloacimonetes bacterium]|nr:glycosyltransferase family 2 protein [Candidatus Cloacimonadota bacterium]
MNKVSAVIICKNEEHDIRDCLESVKWADEIVVYDSGSTDKTLDICKEYTSSIYHCLKWEWFGKARFDAVNLAKYDWVYMIDADERVSIDLQKKIIAILEQNDHNEIFAYRVKYVNFVAKKKIRFSGWNNQYKIRFFNRQYGNYNLNKIHEKPIMNCKVAKINAELLHYTFSDISEQVNQMIYNMEEGANDAFKKGKTANIITALFRGFYKFLSMYILKLGFLDGKIGLILAVNSGFGTWMKYVYLSDLCKKKKENGKKG